ncbi:MAG TPA: hypothetical protein VGU61_21985 [Noviherbaspirillum sp.]|uniref:hypothetical protein n=1 Tax=Noviherbaspirillum sp. TaxID=1926288 RepID=UPI002DDD5802|nr:hypothetical protein [Noviherbaspirillum sp.]HEV2612945.1 hypothetical protein [Noviherbaspirillum sp.]
MLTVLVVDPYPALADTIADMLRACQHVAIALDDYAAGLKLLDTVAFDALIVSIDDSDVISVSFALAAKAKQPMLFVVGVGNFSDQPSELAGSTIDVFVGKPFSVEQIERSFRDLDGALRIMVKRAAAASTE